jgi:thiamine transport system ATP-binding protein
MLELDGVRVAMEGGSLAADLQLRPGQKIAVLGPSGAGKSTLLDAIAGFRVLDSGRVLWQGMDLTDIPPQGRPMSILFQDANLFPHLSIARNLGLALRPHGRRLDHQAQVRVEKALAEVGLEGFGTRKPETLSGGQLSRAALARVLLQDRPILLLDEPFSALGPAVRHEMLDLVLRVADRLGALTLMVTHDADDARRFADAVVLVETGRVHPPVPTGTIFANPPEALRRYLGS